MIILMENEEIIKEINSYQNPQYMWLEFWEVNEFTVQLVLTINHELLIRNGTHKCFRICEIQTDEEEPTEIKQYASELKKFLKRNFKDKEIHSNFHFRW